MKSILAELLVYNIFDNVVAPIAVVNLNSLVDKTIFYYASFVVSLFSLIFFVNIINEIQNSLVPYNFLSTIDSQEYTFLHKNKIRLKSTVHVQIINWFS